MKWAEGREEEKETDRVGQREEEEEGGGRDGDEVEEGVEGDQGRWQAEGGWDRFIKGDRIRDKKYWVQEEKLCVLSFLFLWHIL